jgi:hypothetical protein
MLGAVLAGSSLSVTRRKNNIEVAELDLQSRGGSSGLAAGPVSGI